VRKKLLSLVLVIGLASGPFAAAQQEGRFDQSPPPSETMSTRTTTVSTTTLNPWVWYGTPAALLLAVVLSLVVYAALARRKQRGKKPKSSTQPDRPHAFLVLQGDEQTRYPITADTWRIGRGSDNDLTIPDHSVSRQHAEIHRNANGGFTILDLESLNGVFVNDKKVRSKHILEGDLIDVGDVSFRFTLRDAPSSSQEAPTMLGGRDLPEA
jgi:hypothetical protein